MAVCTLCDVFYRIKWLALRHFQMHLPVSPKERYIIYFWHITQTPPVLEIAIVSFFTLNVIEEHVTIHKTLVYIWFALRCKAGWGISYLLSKMFYSCTIISPWHISPVFTQCAIRFQKKNQSDCNKDSET